MHSSFNTDSRWYSVYNRLIDRARGREINEYTEKHHVVPSSITGTKKTETVKLTAREHFIAHELLVRFVKAECRKAMLYALYSFRMPRKGNSKDKLDRIVLKNSRQFEVYRLEFSRILSEANDWTTTRRWATDEIINIRLMPNEKLPTGFRWGRCYHQRKAVFDINKDGKTIRVEPEEIQQYLNDGWTRGRAPNNKVFFNNGIHSKKYTPGSEPTGWIRGNPKAATATNRKWVTDGTTELYLQSNQEIPNGFIRGRIGKAKFTPKSTRVSSSQL